MESKSKIFLLKMVEVLGDQNTTLLSDTDIFYLVNSLLEKEDRISMRYFEYLKSPNQDNKRSISQSTVLSEEEKEEFISALRVSRIKQKMALTEKAFDDKLKNAYPYLWSLERKNTELQLRKNDDNNVINRPLINITASNDEHKILIDNLLSGEPIQLQPIKKEKKYVDVEFIEIEESINPQIENE